MNISNKGKKVIPYIVIACGLLTMKVGWEIGVGLPLTIAAVAKIVDVITEDGVNLGKPGESIFRSNKPYNYNKYRRAYRSRR